LSKRTDLEININEFEGIIKKLGARKENESAIKEGRMVFRQQLKSIITDFETA